MPTADDPWPVARHLEIVGRIQPETALEMLSTDLWTPYAIVQDPVGGRPVTLIRHARDPHVVVVEGSGGSIVEPEQPDPDPEDPPGPWPDA